MANISNFFHDNSLSEFKRDMGGLVYLDGHGIAYSPPKTDCGALMIDVSDCRAGAR